MKNRMEEARINFEERMASQSPRPLTEEQKRKSEERQRMVDERILELNNKQAYVIRA